MDFLEEHAPVLLSPKFHGLVLYLLLSYLQAKQWIGGSELEHLTQLVGLTTGVGIVDSMARKMGGLKRPKK